MDVTCSCGTTFKAKHPRAKYCSDRCRKRGQRGGQVVDILPPTKADANPSLARGPVEMATVSELETAGRLDTAVGQSCLALARRLDAPGLDTGSAMAAVAARHEALLASATKGVAKATSPDRLRDELAARRAKHGA